MPNPTCRLGAVDSQLDQQRSRIRELTTLLGRYTDGRRENRPYPTAIEGVLTLRSDPLKQATQCMIKPALCITVQGQKTATLGSTTHDYGARRGLVVTAELPERGTACAATSGQPYLGLVLELNLETMQELVEEGLPATNLKREGSGPYTLELSTQTIDCAIRTVRLFDEPVTIPVLYPGIMREICYWLFPQEKELQQTAMSCHCYPLFNWNRKLN